MSFFTPPPLHRWQQDAPPARSADFLCSYTMPAVYGKVTVVEGSHYHKWESAYYVYTAEWLEVWEKDGSKNLFPRTRVQFAKFEPVTEA